MSKHYEAPVQVRELEKALKEFTYRNGFEILNVFSDFLYFIINGWTLKGYPGLTNWRYTKEQTQEFVKMHYIWLQIMVKELADGRWYDPFGDLFMSLISPTSAQYKGQFFSPENVCNLMAAMYHGVKEKKKPRLEKIADEAAGSGRMLLAVNNLFPGNYLVAQDVDFICCQMTVCNFLVHGGVGIVTCLNTLTQRDFRGAWLVNEFYYRTGLPSIRPLTHQELKAIQSSEKWRALLVSPEKYEDTLKMGEMWDAFNYLLKNDTNKRPANNG